MAQTRNLELFGAEHVEVPGSLALVRSRPGTTVLVHEIAAQLVLDVDADDVVESLLRRGEAEA